MWLHLQRQRITAMAKRFVGLMVVPVLALVAAKGARPAPHPAPARQPVSHPAQQKPTASPEVIKAQEDLDAVEKRLRGEFEKSDDYTKADAALKQAQADYDAAVRSAVEKIKDKPEYAAAQDTLRKVEEEQLAHRLNPSAAPDPELAGRVMDARMAVRKMELDAGDADPAVKEAKGKLTTAKEAMVQLRAKFEASMKENADYVAAKKALDDAKAKVVVK